LSARWR